MSADLLASLAGGIPVDPLPAPISERDPSVPHAPKRTPRLSQDEFRLAVSNALRYFPAETHGELAPEFANELREYGHIYMYRFRPTEYEMKAYPIDMYPGSNMTSRCIMLMIMNNLDRNVAQFPHECITYGGNGSVFNNWAQYRLITYYLCVMNEEQTLVMMSGHPSGLFPSHSFSPRMVITNGMVIPNYSSKEDYDRLYALGCTIYGQMTAGSYCYIGPQGIVHGTTLTILNAARKYLGKTDIASNTGVVYVSSGLGGMSGAQPKAGRICGVISVIAEVDIRAAEKRHAQGWVDVIISDVNEVIERVRVAKRESESISIAYHGNIVTLWEALADLDEPLVELGSDQTSLHNPFSGGYYPVQLSFDEAQQVMSEDPAQFKSLVEESLRRQAQAINRLTAKGMFFWDYGNSFLLQCSRAGGEVMSESDPNSFRYPSYVEDIMGDIFSLGFGPFRWICSSGKESDLISTDLISREILESIRNADGCAPRVAAQLDDNVHWIRNAHENGLVVGSQARILYAHAEARVKIALAFNEAISSGRLEGPVVLSRDHHDVSGTDSPFRETSNITDGSKFCADMAVQNAIGDSFRGASWVALHNGGGVGWGEVMNGGFGMVLDGSEQATARAKSMLFWDVNNGIARRAWGGNDNAVFAIRKEMEENDQLRVTLPNQVDADVLANACS